MKHIYLDNSATTMLDPKVIEAMNEANKVYGNPSSIHSFGQEARKIIDSARDTLAEFLNCNSMEIIFTSGGSESDNLAIRGIIDSCQLSARLADGQVVSCQLPHVITSSIEHHAVLHTIQELESQGKIEASYIQPDKNGIVTTSDIEKAIKPNTVLVSVMYVNNEIGTVQPIRGIGKLIEKINLQRNKMGCHSRLDRESRNSNTILDPRVISTPPNLPLQRGGTEPEDDKEGDRDDGVGRVYFHCDAVQATEFLNMDVKYLHVDLLTLTAHKIHGPKGVGALFIKKGTPIKSQITGGDQEFKKRAGTEATSSIAGFATAIDGIKNQELRIKNVETRRDKLENFILKNISETYLNGDKVNRAPHISNISFKNAEGEAIILNLDFLGIAVSSGSACTAHSLDPSHVLTAIKVPRELSHGAIRFSLSKFTTEEEIDRVIEVLPGIIKKLREMSPFS